MEAWLDGLTERVDFYIRGTSRSRRDKNFDWHWFLKLPAAHLLDARRLLKSWLRPLGGKWARGISMAWLRENARALWETRQVLADDLSRRLFDDALILKIVGYRRFYFQPEEFSTIFTVQEDRPPDESSPLRTYIGAPLRDLSIAVPGGSVRVIVPSGLIDGLNAYRQYFVHRSGVNFSPAPSEVVFDCGACIGDVGILFAGMVGPSGQVHMFDPMPTHAQFCQYQVSQNPHLENCVHIVPMAVGARSDFEGKTTADTGHINPSARATPEMPFVAIDDYVERLGIKVDYIKMDIEGGELSALDGAAKTIATQKPRLAISAYHRDDDLWTIREKLLALNPNYQLHFGHHTPIQWESVIYAVDKG
nr:FkbM family methyltransferase [Dyella sp. ASV24]